MLTTTEIDRELDSRTKEVAAMSSTLVELDSHPGLEHVRRYTPTGVTAQRWAVVESALAQLWQDLGRMTSILESAQTVRGRRSKLDDDDRAELTKLLRERSLEVARQPIPLSQREIGAPAELVEYAGLVDTANRMRDTYPAVVEFLDARRRDRHTDRKRARTVTEEARRGAGARTDRDRRSVDRLRRRPAVTDRSGRQPTHHRDRPRCEPTRCRTRRTRCFAGKLARGGRRHS